MAAPGYVMNTGAAAIALAAATAKTTMMLVAGTNDSPTITELSVSFDGVTATAVPVLIELVLSTQGAAGTSTGGTLTQIRGWPAMSANITGQINYTVEPTTLTSTKMWLFPPTAGTFVLQHPLGREPQGIVAAATIAKGLGVRITAPAVVNTRGYLEWEE